VLGEASRGPALELWLASRRHGSSDRVQTPSISLAEIKALMKLNPDAESYFHHTVKENDKLPARFTDVGIVTMAAGMLGEAITQFADRPVSERLQPLVELFACRDEDWIVPIAYAVERAYRGRPSRALSRSLAFYNRDNQEKQSEESRSDMVINTRNADEAGDLGGFTNMVLAECNPELEETKELRFLLDCRDAWRWAIGNIISSGEGLVRGPKSSFGVLSNISERIPPPSEEPPEPGPIRDFGDPQRGRWGGQSTRDHREVRVVIESVERDIFYFSVIVESTDSTPLAAPIVFHLHDSFPRSVVTIRRIENQQATLREWNASGVFTIGVQVKNAASQWISLEIDLANAPGLPKRFLER
jgi:hypothetical protein